MWQGRPVPIDDAEEVHVPHPPQLVGLEALGLGVNGHDRVGHVGVDPPEALDGGVDDPLDLGLAADIAGDGKAFGTDPLDLGDAVVEGLGVPGRDDHLRAALAGLARDRPAEAARGACDNQHLLVQRFLCHCPSIPTRGSATLRA